jgi:hypothetical protein
MHIFAYSPPQISAFWSGVTGVTAIIKGIVAIVSLCPSAGTVAIVHDQSSQLNSYPSL